MKLLFGFVFLGIAQVSLAGSLPSYFLDGHTYQSKGDWQGSDGKKGSWTSVTTYTVIDDKTINMTGTTTVEGAGAAEPMKTEAVLKETGEGQFDIQKTDGAKIGDGYCMKTDCHMAFVGDGFSYEETYNFTANHRRFRVLGSMHKTSEESTYVVFWNGRGSKQKED